MAGVSSCGAQCVCLTKFLQVFHFCHAKTCTKNKCTSIDTHFFKLTRTVTCEEQKHTSLDTLEIEMTCIIRQFEYYKLKLKYPENITHNSRRTSYTHLHIYVQLCSCNFLCKREFRW